MVKDTEQREVLLELLVLAKKTFEMAQNALNEVAAVREAVRGLDPTFTDVLTQKRTIYRGTSLTTLDEMTAQFESIFQRVKAG
jgi:hypothetical protein